MDPGARGVDRFVALPATSFKLLPGDVCRCLTELLFGYSGRSLFRVLDGLHKSVPASFAVAAAETHSAIFYAVITLWAFFCVPVLVEVGLPKA